MAWKPDYVGVEALKSYVRIDDAQDDDEVALAITAASRAVERATGRQFGQNDTTVERFYTSEWDAYRRRWTVEIDDLMTEDGLAVHTDRDGDDEWDGITAYRLAPRNAAADGKPWTQIDIKSSEANAPRGTLDDVRVTGQFGWTAIPDTVEQATLLQASRFLFRRESPAGVAGSPDAPGGSEIRLLAQADPDVRVMLGPYKRWPRGFA